MGEKPWVGVQLRRPDNSYQWGFRMKGGVDQGLPLYVEQVTPKSIASSVNLQAGDIVLNICNVDMAKKTHDEAKREVLRAGNELDMIVEKGGLNPGAVASAGPGAEPRVQIVEEPTIKMGGPTYKDVKPKTYKVLEEEIPASESGGPQPSPAAAPKPSSIFDRKKQERSGYLHAKGKTISRALGEPGTY